VVTEDDNIFWIFFADMYYKEGLNMSLSVHQAARFLLEDGPYL
jgi:hypothetical protein